MAKTRKRRVKKTKPHQLTKSEGAKKEINWTRVIVIAVGIIIALSMILSLIIIPGTGIN